MKRLFLAAVLAQMAVSAFSQVTVPHSFSSGTTISAAQMNADFQALVTALNSQAALISSLQNQLSTKTALPIGTVVSSFVAPDANLNYMNGSTEWAFADGSVPGDANYTGQFPDLRGQFLRGVNAGRSDGKQDPDIGTRTGGDLNGAGSYESDQYRSHTHSIGVVNSNSAGSLGPMTTAQAANTTQSSGASGGSETRPSNIAVYWYIKVR